jgi:hypothetical protein
VALNLGAQDQAVALPAGRLLLSTLPSGAYAPGRLAPDQGIVLLVEAA